MVFIEVSDKNYNEANKLMSKNRWIVLYHWSNCFHCIELLPIWRSVVNIFNSKSLIAEIEYSNMTYMKSPFNEMMAFPTICVYENGKLIDTFSSKRNVNNLKKFFNKYSY